MRNGRFRNVLRNISRSTGTSHGRDLRIGIRGVMSTLPCALAPRRSECSKTLGPIVLVEPFHDLTLRGPPQAAEVIGPIAGGRPVTSLWRQDVTRIRPRIVRLREWFFFSLGGTRGIEDVPQLRPEFAIGKPIHS